MYAHLERLAMIRGFGVRPIVSDESGGDLVGQEGETVVAGHVRESPHAFLIRSRRIASVASRRRGSDLVGSRDAEVDFSRRGAAKTLMRTKRRVEEETETDLFFEMRSRQRREDAEAEHLLHGSPESFDDGDRAGTSDGTKALCDSHRAEFVDKRTTGELRSAIGDEVLRLAVLCTANLGFAAAVYRSVLEHEYRGW